MDRRRVRASTVSDGLGSLRVSASTSQSMSRSNGALSASKRPVGGARNSPRSSASASQTLQLSGTDSSSWPSSSSGEADDAALDRHERFTSSASDGESPQRRSIARSGADAAAPPHLPHAAVTLGEAAHGDVKRAPGQHPEADSGAPTRSSSTLPSVSPDASIHARSPLMVAPQPLQRTSGCGEPGAESVASPGGGRLFVPPFVIPAALHTLHDRTREVNVAESFRKGSRQLPVTLCPPPVGEPMSPTRLFPRGSDRPPDVQALKAHLLRQGQVRAEDAVKVLQMSTDVLRQEPNLLELPKCPTNPGLCSTPLPTGDVVVIGDTHGQYFDVVKMLHLIEAEAAERNKSRGKLRARRVSSHPAASAARCSYRGAPAAAAADAAVPGRLR
jgi:hypothetical protein